MSRRFLFVAFLVVLVAGALVAGHASSASNSAPNANAAVDSSVVAATDTIWFCPGLPPALPHAAARVTFSNIGDATADVDVSTLADKGKLSHLTFQVPASSVVTKLRDQLGSAGALTIETFGGRVLVEEGIEGVQAVETTACATQTATHWNFSAGTTPRGVQQWLVIDNPYASDARVNVTLRTDNGLLRPDALQGLDIARRSRAVIAVHEIAVRKDRVAVEVDADVGSVVAAQTLVYTALAGRPGVALSLGTPAAAEWTFAGALAQRGSTALVAIANVGSDDAQVEVQATPESSKTVLAPASISVAQDDVVWVMLGQCSAVTAKMCIAIPPGVRYSLDVRSDQDVSIVAQILTRFENAPAIVGTVTAPGGRNAATSWAFARSRARAERSTTLSLYNPSAAIATANVALVHDGRVDRPTSLRGLKIPPGRAVTVVVVGGAKPASYDAAITVSSDIGIFASRTIVSADEASTAVGVITG